MEAKTKMLSKMSDKPGKNAGASKACGCSKDVENLCQFTIDPTRSNFRQVAIKSLSNELSIQEMSS